MHRRTKVVSIRLSDDEYDQLQSLCDNTKVHSLSEMARRGLKLLFQAPPLDNDSVETRIREIVAHMSLLDREVARLHDAAGLTRLNQ